MSGADRDDHAPAGGATGDAGPVGPEGGRPGATGPDPVGAASAGGGRAADGGTRAPGPDHEPRNADVLVLLALHRGGAHLAQQLDSLDAQEGGALPVLVSDDAPPDPADHGPAIVRARAEAARTAGRPPIRLIRGPGAGAAANFLHLLREAGGARAAALCDQDDVWLPHKTARALGALAAVPDGVPAIHCGRTLIADARARPLRPCPLHDEPPTFGNALVQSLAGGNTMTLNRAALELARACAGDLARAGLGIVVHDWWLYQVVSGAGGRMLYDPEPLVLYRQHGGNEIGENTSPRALAARAAMVLGGRFRGWSEVNLAALGASAHRFTPEARATLEGFAAMRRAPLAARMRMLRGLGLRRQTAGGRAALWAATLLGRV